MRIYSDWVFIFAAGLCFFSAANADARPTATLPGIQHNGSVQLPNQWSLRPAGRQVVVGDFPVNLALHPGRVNLRHEHLPDRQPHRTLTSPHILPDRRLRNIRTVLVNEPLMDPLGGMQFQARNSMPRSVVELRAEMNVLVILNTCPHPLDASPRYNPRPVRLSIRRAAPVLADDPCRISRPENMRGFTLTERYFA